MAATHAHRITAVETGLSAVEAEVTGLSGKVETLAVAINRLAASLETGLPAKASVMEPVKAAPRKTRKAAPRKAAPAAPVSTVNHEVTVAMTVTARKAWNARFTSLCKRSGLVDARDCTLYSVALKRWSEVTDMRRHGYTADEAFAALQTGKKWTYNPKSAR